MISDVRVIRQARKVNAEITPPPSKSYMNRALIAAALAEGTSTLINPSISDDSKYMIEALKQFGVSIRKKSKNIEIEGTAGKLHAPSKEIFVGNAGTAMRFLATFASLAPGKVILNGDEQMRSRPIQDLLEGLRIAGVKSVSNNGFPPVEIHGGTLNGGSILLNASVSSQFASSILLSCPYAKHQTILKIKGPVSSIPYIDMTLHVMRSFGAEILKLDPFTYQISNRDKYIAQEYTVEGDATSASYFLGAAAITGGRVSIANLSPDSLQGDVKFLNVLEEMGCRVTRHEDSVELHGETLRGIEVDMNELPDCVPTLAVIAAFARGTTAITNVRHLQFKETNRLTALASELTKIGAKVELYDDGLVIHPQQLHGATIETYNDHRMAMSFAIAGLRIQGIEIKNPMCVTKSFPGFWEVFEKLEG